MYAIDIYGVVNGEQIAISKDETDYLNAWCIYKNEITKDTNNLHIVLWDKSNGECIEEHNA